MLSLIKTDFAYVLSGDDLYYINQNNNTCVLSQMDGKELETAKAGLISVCDNNQKENAPVEIGDVLNWTVIGEGARKDHNFIYSSLSLTAQKAILNMVLQLTDLMDNTIKSLKGSPNYSHEQQAMLVERFVTLLHPYYQLMYQNILTIDTNKLKQLYPQTAGVDSFDHVSMLRSIREALDRPNREPHELNMSVVSAVLGSYANFGRQFFKMQNGQYVLDHQQNLVFRGTFEDLFSLIHQNILSAISIIRHAIVKTPMDSLPDEIHPLLSTFAQKSSDSSAPKLNLLSVAHHFPILTLEYNLPMANHSANFITEYNQNTRQVTLQGQIFGGNWQNRMVNLAKYINMDSVAFAVQVKKPPTFSEQTFCMDFIWEFPANRLQDISAHLSHSFRSYDQLLNTMSGSRTDDLSNRYQGINLLESFVSQGRLALIKEIKEMDSSWRDLMKGEVKLAAETSQSITNWLNSLSDPNVVVFIMEKVAESNEAAVVQEFFNSLEVIRNPALRDTRFMADLEKSSVPAFKQAIDSAIAEQKSAAIHMLQKYKAGMDELTSQEQDAMKPSVFRPKS